jgi:hypothetical protein
MSTLFPKYKMILEEVRPHPSRDDIYINFIVTPSNEIQLKDKKLVNRILIKEVARDELKVVA